MFDSKYSIMVRKTIKKKLIDKLRKFYPEIFIEKINKQNFANNIIQKKRTLKTNSKEVEILNESNVEKYFIKKRIANGFVYIKRKNVSFNYNEKSLDMKFL